MRPANAGPTPGKPSNWAWVAVFRSSNAGFTAGAGDGTGDGAGADFAAVSALTSGFALALDFGFALRLVFGPLNPCDLPSAQLNNCSHSARVVVSFSGGFAAFSEVITGVFGATSTGAGLTFSLTSSTRRSARAAGGALAFGASTFFTCPTPPATSSHGQCTAS